METLFVSITIPCKKIDNLAIECLKHCLSLDYKNFEILLLPDTKEKYKQSKKLRIIETGNVMPAVKRNVAMKKARGKIFAFLDSDAYPEKNWLKNAVRYLKEKDIAAVGGPQLTPKKANFIEHAAGHTLANFFVAGKAAIRYKIAKNQFVNELPSANLIVKKEYANKFIPGLLTAEDSKFCFDILKKGKKVLYAKDVIVYHHRRNTIKKHLDQMRIYGRDIALLTKKEFSFSKLYYSLLSLFSLYIFLGLIFSFFYKGFKNFYLVTVLVYLIIMLLTSMKKNLKISLLVFMLSILTHFAYGIGYIQGLGGKTKK